MGGHRGICGMSKNFKVCEYTFYLFESYKQKKWTRSIYYTLLTPPEAVVCR